MLLAANSRSLERQRVRVARHRIQVRSYYRTNSAHWRLVILDEDELPERDSVVSKSIHLLPEGQLSRAFRNVGALNISVKVRWTIGSIEMGLQATCQAPRIVKQRFEKEKRSSRYMFMANKGL